MIDKNEKTFFKIFAATKKQKFDKDNFDHISIVCLLGNLRAYNFNIEFANETETRKLIGNIIPAINSTNAFFAGCVVFELTKIY